MLKITQIILALALLWGFQAHAFTDAQNQSVEQMGKLNGIALVCRFFDQVTPIKKALVEALPKRRELGRAFEAVTDKAYREFIAAKATCPTAEDFAADLDAAIQALNQSFSSK